MRVGRNQIQAARRADLYEYLLRYHPNTVKRADHSRLQHIDHDSLIITKGMGFCHNSKGETGNGVDFLTRYLGYDFPRAVAALSTFEGECFREDIHQTSSNTLTDTSQNAKKAPFKAPERFDGPFTKVWAYMTKTRKIDAKIVQFLFDKGLLYEEYDQKHDKHNCIFLSQNAEYAEKNGTLSNVKFKGSVANVDEDGYWMFGATDSKIYVCESAIDAVSLYQLRHERAGYASIGGLKDKALHRIQADFPSAEIVIAVDADSAGDAFAAKHTELKRILPEGANDWNELLGGPAKED